MTIGYIVLAKRPNLSQPGKFDYTPAGSVCSTKAPVVNHLAWCRTAADADTDSYGDDVQYVIGRIEFDD